MGKIANPALAQAIADGIVKPANQLKAKNIKPKKEEPVTNNNSVAALPGGEGLAKVEKKTLEHIQHHYDKDAKIQKQSCMKAAASVYNPPFGEAPEVIADKVIQIAEKIIPMGELKLINIDKETNYDEWLSFRTTGLGASDVGTLMGLNPYKSKIELFYQKLGLIPIKQDENIPMFYGNRLEEFVANMWEYYDGEDPESVIRNYNAGTKIRHCREIKGYITNSDYPHLFLSPDRVMVSKESDKVIYGGKLVNKNFTGILEVKTINGFASKQWEGGIPPSYVTQLQTYLFGLELEYGEIVFLEDGRKLWTIPMEINHNLKDQIISQMNEFMDRIEAAKADIENVNLYEPEPDGTEAFEKFLNQRYNDSESKTLQGTDELFSIAVRHKVLATEIKEMENQSRECSNLLKNYMKEYEALDFGETKGKVVWRTDARGIRSLRNNIKLSNDGK